MGRRGFLGGVPSLRPSPQRLEDSSGRGSGNLQLPATQIRAVERSQVVLNVHHPDRLVRDLLAQDSGPYMREHLRERPEGGLREVFVNPGRGPGREKNDERG